MILLIFGVRKNATTIVYLKKYKLELNLKNCTEKYCFHICFCFRNVNT